MAELGEASFIGSSGRVFPESFRAVPLLRSWLSRLQDHGVTFFPRHSWLGWDMSGERPAMLFHKDSGDGASGEHRQEYDSAILALGGASWPKVSSDGSWAETLTNAGVQVAQLQATNCGVNLPWSAPLVDRFAGEPVKNAAVIVDGNVVRGDPIVTRTGFEGGPIYAHSRRIREAIAANGEATLTIDLMPDLDIGDMVRRLVERRRKKRSTSTWLDRCGISPVGISLMREVTNNDLPTDPDALGELIKAIAFRVQAMSDIDRAISSAGGVKWSEVDERLQLKAKPGTYVVGEMLDWEAPTGGYLLQAVMSTGRFAGAAICQT